MAAIEKITVIANRLHVYRVRQGRVNRWHPSSGGLVTAMLPVLKRHGGAWVGWTGWPGQAPRAFSHDGIRAVPVSLNTRDVEAFYLGFSNATLWPLYHDAVRSPRFELAWWKSYVEVNWRYARAAAGQARKGQVVWVHDYQLQLVPQMLRELRPDVRVGFFMHIPFPPDELFAWLPWRREILEGLLGADVVGFQTGPDAQDFSRAARQFTSAEGTDRLLRFNGRAVRVGAFPISVDFARLEALARRPETVRRGQDIRRRVGAARKVLLSVDRLDYTKGIDARLLAFEELLRRGLATVDDCVFIQIADPSRETVPEYVEMRTQIERIVGQINGEFSHPGRVAVHYFRRNFSLEELAGFYAAADVMVVTPLRDGMNLVSKEYVATRSDHSGVLILSEFAGAAWQLRQALVVNPRDLDGMVRVMDTALHLPRKEARTRMSILRTQVRRHDVYEWANDFLEALQ